MLYGARATGNVTSDVRIGVMNTLTGKNDNNANLSQTAVAAQKRFGLSNVQALFTNQQSFGGIDPNAESNSSNASLEGLFKSDDGQKSLWAGVHQSFKEGISDQTGFYNLGGQFQNADWNFSTDFIYAQENYFTDLGFNLRVENFDAVRDTVIRLSLIHI